MTSCAHCRLTIEEKKTPIISNMTDMKFGLPQKEHQTTGDQEWLD